MKTETKFKKVIQILTNIGYDLNTANDAIAKTNRSFPLEKYTPSYFVQALQNTYGIEGVER